MEATPSLDAIRKRISNANAAYAIAQVPDELPPVPRLSLAIVTCVDCRLTGRLEPALGLRPGDAAIIRVAGNTTAGTEDLTRSLAVLVFEQNVRTILVIGHTDCGLRKVDPLAFAEHLSARGVSRFALGSMPLRDWLGIFRDEAQNVRDTVSTLRSMPILPRDIAVAGALFDVRTGELTWVDV